MHHACEICLEILEGNHTKKDPSRWLHLTRLGLLYNFSVASFRIFRLLPRIIMYIHIWKSWSVTRSDHTLFFWQKEENRIFLLKHNRNSICIYNVHLYTRPLLYLWWKLVKVTSNIEKKIESSRSIYQFILRICFWSLGGGALPASSFALYVPSVSRKVEEENKGELMLMMWSKEGKLVCRFVQHSYYVIVIIMIILVVGWIRMEWNGFVVVVIVLIDGDVIIIWKVKGDGFFDTNFNIFFSLLDWMKQMGFTFSIGGYLQFIFCIMTRDIWHWLNGMLPRYRFEVFDYFKNYLNVMQFSQWSR